MNFVIYLDQNTLSNFRQRKIDEMKIDEYMTFKTVLKLDLIITVYAHAILQEISQINTTSNKKSI